MGLFNAKHNLLAIFLCTLLIMQPIVAIPPQELYGEPCQAYAFLYFISFFMVTALCALIHKYFSQPPIAQPLIHETSSPITKEIYIGEHRSHKKQHNKEMNPTQQLQAQMQTIKARQEKMNSATIETKKAIDQLTKTMLIALCFFAHQTAVAHEKNQQLLQKVLTTKHKDCIPIVLFTCYVIAHNKQKIFMKEQTKHIETQNILIIELQKNKLI